MPIADCRFLSGKLAVGNRQLAMTKCGDVDEEHLEGGNAETEISYCRLPIADCRFLSGKLAVGNRQLAMTKC
ncbi:MAG TPA: hypothetical protein VHS05_23825, partial [Pyrinomonadaceae bacterium]|nr:hypothetical protein [Pyrinomonadaceae bacterium]